MLLLDGRSLRRVVRPDAAIISGLEAVHDFKPFKEYFEGDEAGWQQLRKFEDIYRPATHPVVRVHPITGKKALFVNPQFTLHIKGMEETESRTLLDTLFRTIHTLEYQYRHRWQPNMIVFWDNRWVQHAAVHDYYPQRRMMERVTIKGDRPFGTGEVAPVAQIRRRKVHLSWNTRTGQGGSTKWSDVILRMSPYGPTRTSGNVRFCAALRSFADVGSRVSH